MTRRLVVKRLSASDLTLFKAHFDKTSGAKQKAINLDVDPFISALYPSLPAAAAETPRGAIPLDLSLYGPGLATQQNVARKILKQQKNWRLNGEYISDPDDQPGRYNSLQKGDYAIFDFYGEIVPQSVRIYFIAENDAHDIGLHAAVKKMVDSQTSAHKSMLIMDLDMVESIVSGISIDPSHPVLDLFEEADLEDAAQGGTEGIQRLTKRRAGRSVKHEELQRAKKNAERIGRLGEELVNSYFEELCVKGELNKYKWDADENAVSPFDFSITVNKKDRLIDVKSTVGPFKNRIHVSTAELIKMRDAEEHYDLYRLYEASESGAKCRIARNVKETAAGILKALETLPVGVTVDGIASSPDFWDFLSDKIDISGPDEEKEEDGN